MTGKPETYDVIIAGAGPAGSASAICCAQAGLKTLVIEKAIFPREKVCGDCINPSAWPIFERLGVVDRLLGLPHAKLSRLEFISLSGRSVQFQLTASGRGEMAVKRSLLDQLLLQRALECGASAMMGTSISALEKGWSVRAGDYVFTTRFLIAADGRNSTIARLAGVLPAAAKERVALQTHLPKPSDFHEKVTLRFLPDGYCGIASVSDDEIDVCLVGKAPGISSLKAWAEKNLGCPPSQSWRTITPLARGAIDPAQPGLLFVGDAARVVEPFTGEGIYYALASAELAAQAVIASLRGDDFALENYRHNHATLYANRLWVNRIAKQAVLHPRLGSYALDLLPAAALRFLARKIVGDALN